VASRSRIEVELVLSARNDLRRVLDRLGPDTGKASREMERELNRADRSLKRIGVSAKMVSNDFGFLGRAAAGALGNLTARLVSAGVAFLGFRQIGERTRDALEFKTAMAEVATILPTTETNVDALSDSVLELAKAQGLNENIVARGLYQTISAGFSDAADAAAVLGVSAKLATAGVADTNQAVDLITTGLNAYRLGVENATRISDVFFETVRLGKTTITELSSSIGQSLPIASALGIDIEQVSAALAVLTQQGFGTSEAATLLNATFKALLKQGKLLDPVFRRVGETYDLNTARTKGFAETLRILRSAIRDDAEALEVLGGRAEATQALIALTGKSYETLISVLAQLRGSAGATEKAFGIFTSNAAFQFERFTNAVRIESLTIGDAIIGGVNDALAAFGGFDKITDGLGATFRGIAPVIRGATTAVTEFALRIPIAIGEVAELNARISKLGSSIDLFAQGAAFPFRALGVELRTIAGIITELAADPLDDFRDQLNLVESEIRTIESAAFDAARSGASLRGLGIGGPDSKLAQLAAEAERLRAVIAEHDVPLLDRIERVGRKASSEIDHLVGNLEKAAKDVESADIKINISGKVALKEQERLLAAIAAEAGRTKAEVSELTKTLAQLQAQLGQLVSSTVTVDVDTSQVDAIEASVPKAIDVPVTIVVESGGVNEFEFPPVVDAPTIEVHVDAAEAERAFARFEAQLDRLRSVPPVIIGVELPDLTLPDVPSEIPIDVVLESSAEAFIEGVRAKLDRERFVASVEADATRLAEEIEQQVSQVQVSLGGDTSREQARLALIAEISQKIRETEERLSQLGIEIVPTDVTAQLSELEDERITQVKGLQELLALEQALRESQLSGVDKVLAKIESEKQAQLEKVRGLRDELAIGEDQLVQAEKLIELTARQRSFKALDDAGDPRSLSGEEAAFAAAQKRQAQIQAEVDLTNELTISALDGSEKRIAQIELERQALQNRIDTLEREGTIDAEAADRLRTKTDLTAAQRVETDRAAEASAELDRLTAQVADSGLDKLASAITDAAFGIESFQDAVKTLGRVFIQEIAQMLIRVFILQRALDALIAKQDVVIAKNVVVAATGGGGIPGTGGSTSFPLAKGGVINGPFQAFASGGIATGPTFGLIAEAGKNEAVVPLPDNRNIPVKLLGGGGAGSTAITVQMSINAVDGRSVATMLASPEAQSTIEETFRNALIQSMSIRDAVGTIGRPVR